MADADGAEEDNGDEEASYQAATEVTCAGMFVMADTDALDLLDHSQYPSPLYTRSKSEEVEVLHDQDGAGTAVVRAQGGGSMTIGGSQGSMSSMRNSTRKDEDDLLDLNLNLSRSPPSGGVSQGSLTFWCTHMWGVVPGGGVRHEG